VHMQIRLSTSKSPADLVEVLEVIAAADLSIVAAGGSNIEGDGEFAFAVKHGQERRAMQALQDADYKPRLVKIKLCELEHRAGSLRDCVRNARAENEEATGRIVDVTVGVAGDNGLIPVQVYFENAEEVSLDDL
jgi:hypothetical protein